MLGESKKYFIFLGCIIAAALGLRLFQIGDPSYWLDEIVSVHFAKHPDPKSIFWDNNPFLYHLLLKGWVHAFGDSEFATRFLSTLFSLGSTSLLFALLYSWIGLPGAVAVGLLHATSIFSIEYAQETRMYAMFEFFVSLHLYYLLKQKQKDEHIKGVLLSALGMSLSSYLAVIPLGLEGVYLAWRRRNAGLHWRSALVSMAVGFFFLVASYLNSFRWDALNWQFLKYTEEASSRYPMDVLADICNQNIFGALATVTLLTLGFRQLWLNKKRYEFTLLALLIFSPIPCAQIFSLISHRAVFLPRYFIFLIPPLMFVTSYGAVVAWNSKRKILRFGVLSVAALGIIFGVPKAYLDTKSPWRTVAEVISQSSNSTVLTTRTIAIKDPYFERFQIPVRKWDPQSPAEISYLLQQVGQGKTVWIVESFWSGRPYMSSLALVLANLKLKVEEFSYATPYSKPVLVLKVLKAHGH